MGGWGRCVGVGGRVGGGIGVRGRWRRGEERREVNECGLKKEGDGDGIGVVVMVGTWLVV